MPWTKYLPLESIANGDVGLLVSETQPKNATLHWRLDFAKELNRQPNQTSS